MMSNETSSISVPENAVKVSSENKFGISVWLFTCDQTKKQILFTKGMSAFNQKKQAENIEFVYPFIELYFLLPNFWGFNKPNQKWPIQLIEKLMNVPNKKQTWFGPGDTMMANRQKKSDLGSTGSLITTLNQVANPINELFKQKYLILNEPIAAKEILNKIQTNNINWLSITPIFSKEFEYKESRSAYELFDHFNRKKVTEEIDQYRTIAIKKRFFGLF